MQQRGKAGDGAFHDWRRGQGRERRPEMLLDIRGDSNAFAYQNIHQPVGGPCPFWRVMDAGERLERHRVHQRCIVGERATQILPVATHGKRGGTDGTAEVEGENLRAFVTPELERHEGEQHALAGTCRANDHRVPDVADMKGEAERRRPFGLGVEQRRRVEMLILLRSGPDRR